MEHRQTNRELADEIARLGRRVTRLQSKQRQMEKQLCETESRYRGWIDSLPGMAYRCHNDRDWTMASVSAGCLDLTGYAAADLIDNRRVAYGNLIYPDDQAQVWNAVQAGVRDRAPYDLVYRIRTATGHAKWVMERGHGVYAPNGDLLLLEGFISDLTEYKRTEAELQQARVELEQRVQTRTAESVQANEALRQQTASFESLARNANDGLLIATGPGRLVYANGRAAEILGYSIPELVRITFDDLEHPDGAVALAERYRRRMAGEPVPNQYETVVRHQDGHPVPIELTGTKITWQNEPADLVILRDTTARKQAERALQHERDFSAAILDTTGALIIVLNRAGGIVQFNRACEQLTGYALAEVRGRPLWGLLIPEEEAEPARAVFARLEAGQVVGPIIEYWRIKTGQRRLITWTGTVLRDAAGAVEYVVSTGLDVTDRRELEELRIKNNVIASALTGIATSSLDGTLTYANPACIAMLGYANPQQIVGHSSRDIFKDPQQWQTAMATLQSQGSWIGEIDAVRADGMDLALQVAAHRVTGADGAPLCLAASLVDITERRRMEIALRSNLAKYATLFEAFPLGITITDHAGRILETNCEAEHILGMPRQEHEHRTVDDPEWHAIRPDGTPLPAAEFPGRRALNEKRRIENAEMGVVQDTGQVVWLNVTAAPIANAQFGVAIAYSDITERKEIEAALRASEYRYRSLFENSLVGIFLTDPRTGAILAANPEACRLTGYAEAELRRSNRVDVLDLADERLAAALAERTRTGRFHGELKMRRADGSVFPAELASTLFVGSDDYLVASIYFSDISDRKRTEEQLRHLSIHDSLTGIYNRTFFEAELARLDHDREFPVSICIADLDDMKKTNDTLGHAAGDELLRRAAEVLQAVFRTSDILARIGGDEFALILPDTDASTAAQILVRIRESVALTNQHRPDLRLGLSLGAATADHGSLIDAFRQADARMYADKRLHKEQTGQNGAPSAASGAGA